MLVDADATLLHHLAGLTLRGEDGSLGGKKLKQGHAGLYVGTRDLESGDTFQHVEQRLLVERAQSPPLLTF